MKGEEREQRDKGKRKEKIEKCLNKKAEERGH